MKEHQNMVNNLAKGDEVVTAGGLIGKVTKVKADSNEEVASGVELRFQKAAVSAALPKGTLKS